MARLARVVVAGVGHHVTQRGDRRQPTFFLEDDYQAYLALLGEPALLDRIEKRPGAWFDPPNVTPGQNLRGNKYGIRGTPSKEDYDMGKLTGTRYGDAANELFAFYQGKAQELEETGQYYMAAIALAFALETGILTYLLVEFGEDNGGELEIPDRVNMAELIDACNELDVLNAPISIPSHVRQDNEPPKYMAKDVVDKIRKFRNLIHPAVALREGFDPSTFTKEQLTEFKEMYGSVTHSLCYYL
jgi:hypothetical protein